MSSAFRIALNRLACLEETGEPSASDEPYVIVFAVDITRPDGADLPGDLPQYVQDALAGAVPSTHTVAYGPWSDTDAGETKSADDFDFSGMFDPDRGVTQGPPVAAFHQPVGSADDVLILVGLVENDEANPANVRLATHAALTGALASYWSDFFRGDITRGDLVDRLREDMRDVLRGLPVTGIGFEPVFPGFGVFPNADDLIGVQELRLSQRDLRLAASEDAAGVPYDVARRTGLRSLQFAGDGARYRLDFELVCAPQTDGTAASPLSTADAPTFVPRLGLQSRQSGHLDVVGRGLDRRFYLSSWDGEAWSAWSPLGAGTFRSGPAFGLLRGRGTLEPFVVGRGDDRRLWECTYRAGSWGGWRPIGAGTFQSCPAVAGERVPHLFGTGDDRRVYTAQKVAGRWSAWTPIGTGTFRSAPTAVVRRGGRVDVFATGDDRGVYHASRGAGGWSAWSRVGADATFRSAPAVASWGPDRLDLFAIGDDRGLYHCAWTPAGWQPWARLGAPATFASAPVALSTAPERIDVFCLGEDHAPYHDAWLGDRWSGWLRDTPAGTFG